MTTEVAARVLGEILGHPVSVEDGSLVIALTANDDWDDVYCQLHRCGTVEEWNGAFVPGIRGIFDVNDYDEFEGSEVKLFPVAVVYCGCCC